MLKEVIKKQKQEILYQEVERLIRNIEVNMKFSYVKEGLKDLRITDERVDALRVEAIASLDEFSEDEVLKGLFHIKENLKNFF